MGNELPLPDSPDAATEIDQLLRAAIEQRRLIHLRYGGRDRIVEPHDYGLQNNAARLLAYQVGGSSSNKLPNWRWLDVDGISNLKMLDRTFKGGRRIASSNHHKWDQLFIRVQPSDESKK